MPKNTAPENTHEAPMGATEPAAPVVPSVDLKGKRILTCGILKSGKAATVKVNGPVGIGGFGKYNVPLNLAGQAFVLPLSPKSPDFAAMMHALGPPEGWQGCTVEVREHDLINQVSVRAIADANGKPVV